MKQAFWTLALLFGVSGIAAAQPVGFHVVKSFALPESGPCNSKAR